MRSRRLVALIAVPAVVGAAVLLAHSSTAPYADLGQSFASGSPVALVVAIASIALGALAAAILVRRIRRAPLRPAECRRG